MKASQAKQLMSEAKPTNMEATFYNKIKAAAMLMNNFIWHYQTITALERKELEDNGYKVESMPDRDGILYKISWEG